MDSASTLALVFSIAAILVSGYVWSIVRRPVEDRLTPEEASRAIKKFAERQKVRIELSEEQMKSISDQLQFDPRYPAEIEFVVKDKEIADLKVASCAYWGDTCCA